MKNFLKTLILPVAIIMMLGNFVPRVFATNLTADFNPDPIFGEVANFLPGDTKEGDVVVTNGTPDQQSVYAESVNGFDPDGFGSQLYLRIFENASVIYEDVFSDFLSAGPVALSSLGAGNTTTYSFEVSFVDSADNDYQGKTLGFDLCIGFSGGTFQCGGTVVGNENNTSGGGSGGGGGGGEESGDFSQLVIFSEFVSNIFTGEESELGEGTAIVEWDTNLLATSQVIYGPLSLAPYDLDIDNLPNLGYPSGTAENPIKTLHHSMMLTGLVSGETYVYRVVSRASPPTVSAEHVFTMPATSRENSGIVLANARSSGNFNTDEISEGAGDQDTDTAQDTDDNSNLLASAFGGLASYFGGLLYIGIALILLLILLALLRTVLRNKKDKSN